MDEVQRCFHGSARRECDRRGNVGDVGGRIATTTADATARPVHAWVVASAALMESPVARWPPTRVLSITSPPSSATTATSTIHPFAIKRCLRRPLTITSNSSQSLGAIPGLTPPRPFDEALPTRSEPIIPLSGGNGMAGLYLQRQTKDAAAQVEPSPTWLDHALYNRLRVL